RRQEPAWLTRLNTGLFDVLHDTANDNLFAVTDGVDIHFHGAIEEVIQQYRRIVRYFYRFGHVTTQRGFVVDDFHRPAAQHIGRAHHQRVTDFGGFHHRFFCGRDGGVHRLLQPQTLDHLLETLTVFGAVNGFR